MIKLTRQVESLEKSLAKARERCNTIDDQLKKHQKGGKLDEERTAKLKYQMFMLEQEQNDIANALAFLYDYSD